MKPIMTEKAVMLMETKNVLVFRTTMKKSKTEFKKEFEELFNVKVDKLNSQIKGNQKYFYIKLNLKTPAIDVATKLGLM